ncbi:unnamed protein product [Prorocentrum cordatum]|uniref:RNA-directed DNA polymerase n=1 Tax=Prorocentrum cordatum TaxID=2364126 RepID=A0ABN9WXY8_9DINO|nr:unnamed protein product [Polarella glacialis]
MQLPSSIRWFFAELHRCVQCFSATMTKPTLLYFVQSGIIQGCPGSGFPFALCADPFAQDFDRSVSLRGRGIIRACADDVGAAIARIEVLKVLFRIFMVAARVASLILKISKCKLAPLAAEFPPALADQCRSWIQARIPEWCSVEIAGSLVYLGLRLGPDAMLNSWAPLIQKYRYRAEQAGGGPAEAVILPHQRDRAAPVRARVQARRLVLRRPGVRLRWSIGGRAAAGPPAGAGPAGRQRGGEFQISVSERGAYLTTERLRAAARRGSVYSVRAPPALEGAAARPEEGALAMSRVPRSVLPAYCPA